MRMWIANVKDAQADKNCRYRVIADLLGFGENGWSQLRRDLLGELNVYPHLYEGIYDSFERVKDIRLSLSLECATSYDKWMIMPDMRFFNIFSL